MTTTPLVELLLLYKYNDQLLTEAELTRLRNGYASQLSIEDTAKIKKVLNKIK